MIWLGPNHSGTAESSKLSRTFPFSSLISAKESGLANPLPLIPVHAWYFAGIVILCDLDRVSNMKGGRRMPP